MPIPQNENFVTQQELKAHTEFEAREIVKLRKAFTDRITKLEELCEARWRNWTVDTNNRLTKLEEQASNTKIQEYAFRSALSCETCLTMTGKWEGLCDHYQTGNCVLQPFRDRLTSLEQQLRSFDFASLEAVQNRLTSIERRLIPLDKLESIHIEEELDGFAENGMELADKLTSIERRLDTFEKSLEGNSKLRLDIHRRVQQLEKVSQAYKIPAHKFVRESSGMASIGAVPSNKCTRCGRYELDEVHDVKLDGLDYAFNGQPGKAFNPEDITCHNCGEKGTHLCKPTPAPAKSADGRTLVPCSICGGNPIPCSHMCDECQKERGAASPNEVAEFWKYARKFWDEKPQITDDRLREVAQQCMGAYAASKLTDKKFNEQLDYGVTILSKLLDEVKRPQITITPEQLERWALSLPIKLFKNDWKGLADLVNTEIARQMAPQSEGQK